MKTADRELWSPTLSTEKNRKDGARGIGAIQSDKYGSTAPDFGRLARIYRWMELASFGTLLERCRFAFLNELRGSRNALVLGDGDGRFAGRLLDANPEVRIDAVDASAAMLRALVQRAGWNAARVRTYCADIREWEPAGGGYDLVASHFFLDCLTSEEVEALAGRVRGVVCPAAVWVVSEFAVPEGWFGGFVARPVVWGLYWAFGLLTGLRVRRLPMYHEALRGAGFGLEKRREWFWGLLVSEMWRTEDGG